MPSPSLARPTSEPEFDPYASWFHIQASERPPNPYQLFGMRELEVDRALIRSAIERRRYELEIHRTGAREDVWRRVACEIDEAAQTLNDIELKAMLDASLRRKRRAAGLAGEVYKRLESPDKLECPECSLENAGGRRFCAQCGSSLWRVCANCETECPASEKFCGGCGTNLSEAEERIRAAQEQILNDAIQLHDARRFEEALKMVRPLAVHEDPRFEPLIQRAHSLLLQWRAEYAQWRQRSMQDVDRAEALFAANQLKEAVEVLSSIPEGFHDQRIVQLLAKAHSRAQEFRDLESEIKEAVAKKTFGQLGSKIDRLLELNPRHEECRKLAARLGKALEQTAEKRVAEGQYQRALEMLDEVPRVARGDAYTKIYDRAAEFCWLHEDLAQAPVLNATLLGAAERLAEACPQNTQVSEWLRALRKMRGEGQTAIPWMTSSQRSVVGPAVQLWPTWRRVDTSAVSSQSAFRERVAEWNVACGLALQGLGMGRLNLNLAEEKRGNLLRSLGLGRRKAAVRRAWGIDIGASSLKAIELTADDQGRIAVSRYHYAPWPKPVHRADGDGERSSVVIDALKEFAKQYRATEAERIGVGLPVQSTLIRTIRMPPASDKQLREAVTFEAKHQFPIPLEQLAWDYEMLTSTADQAGTAGTFQHAYAVLTAAKREIVEGRRAEVEASGLRADILQSNALALYNLAVYEQLWDDRAEASREGETTTAVLDVGAGSSCLIIGTPSLVWCRTIPINGDSFTEPLLRHLQLTYAQAEQIKREPLRAKRLSKLYRHLEPVARELIGELRRTFDVFHKDHASYRVQKLLLVGGGARLHGLLRFLRSGC